MNDALFLGVDARHLSPPKGQTKLTGGYSSLADLEREWEQNEAILPEGTARESAGEVAKFLGLVARIHDYVNAQEAKKSLPGCRSVVASGLRKRFVDRRGNDDFFAANFSVSVAYKAQEKGSTIGLKGNSLFVEDDVAVGIAYIGVCHAILALAKFLPISSTTIDPYQYIPETEVTVRTGLWKVHEPVATEIMNQQHVFRRLNSSALTNLQLYSDYRRIQLDENDEKTKLIRDALNRATPERVNSFADYADSLFLRLSFPLDQDYRKFFGTPASRPSS